MSAPSSPTAAHQPAADARTVSQEDRDKIFEAMQARAAAAKVQDDRFDSERDVRQMFRRLIDPGIMRGEHRRARPALDLLLKLADNILNNPDVEKYRTFKPTNTIIKRDLVEVKGAVEYAVALGFRAEVLDFQPIYKWNPKHADELRIGAEMIREELAREDERKVFAERGKVAEKHAAKEAAEKVKLAYADDRRKKQEADRLEKERRIRAAASPAPAAVTRTAPSHHTPQIRGEGRTLDGAVVPPPYTPNAHPADVVHNPEVHGDVHADDAADDDAEEDEDEDMDDAASTHSLRGGRRLGD
ncbi:hypothetical protein AURDEDRAFT_180209 [Auricularia subglabra TFB-10046 SS5]|nr:hypothetical protein AURDEDRAFT_180209 [Auricularia subglabra TFB-10046 SS5]